MASRSEDQVDLGGFLETYVLGNPFELPVVNKPKKKKTKCFAKIKEPPQTDVALGQTTVHQGSEPITTLVLSQPGLVATTPEHVSCIGGYIGSNAMYATSLKKRKVSDANQPVQDWLLEHYMYSPEVPPVTYCLYSNKTLLEEVQRCFPHISSISLSRIVSFTFQQCHKISKSIACWHGLMRKPQRITYPQLLAAMKIRAFESWPDTMDAYDLKTNEDYIVVTSLVYWSDCNGVKLDLFHLKDLFKFNEEKGTIDAMEGLPSAVNAQIIKKRRSKWEIGIDKLTNRGNISCPTVSTTSLSSTDLIPSPRESRRKRRKSQPVKLQSGQHDVSTSDTAAEACSEETVAEACGEEMDLEQISTVFVNDLLAVDEGTHEKQQQRQDELRTNGMTSASPQSSFGSNDDDNVYDKPLEIDLEGEQTKSFSKNMNANKVLSLDQCCDVRPSTPSEQQVSSPAEHQASSPAEHRVSSPGETFHNTSDEQTEPMSLVVHKDENENFDQKQNDDVIADETCTAAQQSAVNGVMNGDRVDADDMSSYVPDNTEQVEGDQPDNRCSELLGYFHILAENNALKDSVQESREKLTDTLKRNRQMALELSSKNASIEQLKAQVTVKDRQLQELATEFVDFSKKFKTLACKFHDVIQSSLQVDEDIIADIAEAAFD